MINYRDNLPDFRRQMAQAGKDFVPIAAAADRAAAVEFAKAVRRSAPRGKTRTLSRAVVIKRARRVPRGTVHYIVGIRQGKSQQGVLRTRRIGRLGRGKFAVNLDAFYWRFLEGGWVPRKPRDTSLRGGRNVQSLRARRARTSGATVVRHPFILPAFQSSTGRALSAFYSSMESGFKKLSGAREYRSWSTR